MGICKWFISIHSKILIYYLNLVKITDVQKIF